MAGVRERVPLAPLTTLELGGPARFLVEVTTPDAVRGAVELARQRELHLTVLGGGSNVVVSDQGVDGLVVRMAGGGLRVEAGPGGLVRVVVDAGACWDDVVRWAVEQDLAGIECLAGIPGTAGATPIQNVGAYGQEVCEVVESVRVIDRDDPQLGDLTLDRRECGFGYRTSLLKESADRFVVLGLNLLLRPGGAPTLRYPELIRAVESSAEDLPEADSSALGLARVRETVLSLRRRKSMLVEPESPDRRSVGSFFVNPVLEGKSLGRIEERAREQGLVQSGAEVPRFDVGAGKVKVPAAWLIQAAGFERSERRGAVGLSSGHVLALVHHGGGSSRELLALAREIRDRVAQTFGVRLRLEPVLLGFDEDPMA